MDAQNVKVTVDADFQIRILDAESWVELTPETVEDIHNKGGTILRSHRGNPKQEDAAAVLKKKGVRQFFVLGGDGSLAYFKDADDYAKHGTAAASPLPRETRRGGGDEPLLRALPASVAEG